MKHEILKVRSPWIFLPGQVQRDSSRIGPVQLGA